MPGLVMKISETVAARCGGCSEGSLLQRSEGRDCCAERPGLFARRSRRRRRRRSEFISEAQRYSPGALRAIARQIREAGITRIEGGVIGDDDLFDDNGFGNGWTLDNLPYGFAAAVSALEYNEGSVDLVIHAGAASGDPVTIHLRTDGSGLRIDNRLRTVAESGTGRLTLPAPARVLSRSLCRVRFRRRPHRLPRTASVDNPPHFLCRRSVDAADSRGRRGQRRRRRHRRFSGETRPERCAHARFAYIAAPPATSRRR